MLVKGDTYAGFNELAKRIQGPSNVVSINGRCEAIANPNVIRMSQVNQLFQRVRLQPPFELRPLLHLKHSVLSFRDVVLPP